MRALLLLMLVMFNNCYAVDDGPPPHIRPPLSATAIADFLVITNEADGDVFLATYGRPNMIGVSGRKNWKYTGTQNSRGYLYHIDVPSGIHSGFVDVWLDEMNIPFPFDGLACRLSTSWYKCAQNGMFTQIKPPQRILKSGAFHMDIVPPLAGFPLNRSAISHNFFNAFAAMGLGQTYAHHLNICTTDELSLTWCANSGSAGGTYRAMRQEFNKAMHIRVQPINKPIEIVTDTNGEATIIGEEGLCVNESEDIRCNISNLSIQYTKMIPTSQIDFSIQLVEPIASISNQDVEFIMGNQAYLLGTNVDLTKIVNGESVALRFKRSFFQKLTAYGLDKIKDKDLFKIVFNDKYSDAGYFEVTSGSNLVIIPRSYSVSIISEEGTTTPYKMGEIGGDDIIFPYKITESGPASSQKMYVSLRQNTGVPYNGICTFYQDSIAVPIKSNLVFLNTEGISLSLPISCDGTPIELRSLKIGQSAPPLYYPDNENFSTFYKVSLVFLMKDKISSRTIENQHWEGQVHQRGTISIKSVWQ